MTFMAGRSEALYLVSLLPSVAVPPWTRIMPSISSIEVSFEETDSPLLQASSDSASAEMYNDSFILPHD